MGPFVLWFLFSVFICTMSFSEPLTFEFKIQNNIYKCNENCRRQVLTSFELHCIYLLLMKCEMKCKSKVYSSKCGEMINNKTERVQA